MKPAWARRGAWIVCLATTVAAHAQTASRFGREEPDSFVNQQRFIQEALRSVYDEQLGDYEDRLFDWGGWYNAYLFVFDDGVESSRTLRRHDLRLWGRWTLDGGAHEFYARTRLSVLDFNTGDSFDGDHDDLEGPNLERGIYRFDLARAMRAYHDQVIDYNVVLTAGRDLVVFGHGITLALPLDHVALRGSYRGFDVRGVAGRTVGSIEDFDLSRPNNRTRRNIFGAELTYRGFERHEPFAYVLWQNDQNDNEVLPLLQGFEYDSFYVGVGSSGELGRNLRYATELAYETGTSFGHRRFLVDNRIEAWAVLAELEYLFPGEHRARASIEYLFGSGDGDRFASPTNSIGGNTRDREDTSFVGLGYRNTGLAFAPRFSNLHMWRAGASYFPWPQVHRLRNLEVGTDWFLYYKHHRDGAVSDPTATVRSGYLGWEMDYFVNWRMTADLAWTSRLGVFFPGDAFRDTSPRTFFLIGMTWSF